jgi:hypothetical protein
MVPVPIGAVPLDGVPAVPTLWVVVVPGVVAGPVVLVVPLVPIMPGVVVLVVPPMVPVVEVPVPVVVDPVVVVEPAVVTGVVVLVVPVVLGLCVGLATPPGWIAGGPVTGAAIPLLVPEVVAGVVPELIAPGVVVPVVVPGVLSPVVPLAPGAWARASEVAIASAAISRTLRIDKYLLCVFGPRGSHKGGAAPRGLCLRWGTDLK